MLHPSLIILGQNRLSFIKDMMSKKTNRERPTHAFSRNFSERLSTARTVEKYCHKILRSQKLVFMDFNEKEIQKTLLETIDKKSIQSVPNRTIKKVFESYTDSQKLIQNLQEIAPKYAYSLIPSLVNAIFYDQARSLFSDEKLRQLIEQNHRKTTNKFTAKYLCLNKEIADDFPVLSFTAASIFDGIRNFKSIELQGLSWERMTLDQPKKDIENLPEIVGLIMKEYEDLKCQIRQLVVVREYDAEEIIRDTFASKHENFRTSGRVIATIRHAHTNYDRLYSMSFIREHKYWMATGHLAVRSVIYEAIMDQSSHEFIKTTVQSLINDNEKKMINLAVHVSKIKNPSQFILDSYTSRIKRNVQNVETKNSLLRFAEE